MMDRVRRKWGRVSPKSASKLAARINTAFFAIFSVWLAATTVFWLRAFGPMLPYGEPRFDASPLAWFIVSMGLGSLALMLPRSFYVTKGFERSGLLYERLGILALRSVITDGDLMNRYVRNRFPGYIVIRGPSALSARLRRGLIAERAHLACFLFGLGTSIGGFFGGWIDYAMLIAVGNVLVNLYPALLQRHTRARIWRIKPDLVTSATNELHGNNNVPAG